MTAGTYPELLARQWADRDANDQAERARLAALEADQANELVTRRLSYGEARLEAQKAYQLRQQGYQRLRSRLVDVQTTALAAGKEALRAGDVDAALEAAHRAASVRVLLDQVGELENEAPLRPEAFLQRTEK